MTAFKLGQPVSFDHPVGRVYGTVAKVEQRAVLVDVHMAAHMPPRSIWFTLRGDGQYRQVGKGNRSPVLEEYK